LSESCFFAHAHHFFGPTFADVEVKQFLLQVQFVAAVFYALREVINLEQEQHVVLVDLLVVAVDQVVDVLPNLFLSVATVQDRLISVLFSQF
jgi:hypothetical protein